MTDIEPGFTVRLTYTEFQKLVSVAAISLLPGQTMSLRYTNTTGIGTNVSAIINGEETDITDYKSW